MATTFLKPKNNAETTITEWLGIETLTVTVADGSVFPLTVDCPFRATIGDEIIHVTANAGNTLTMTRAAEGTTNVAHNSGTGIYLYLTAGAMEEIHDAVNTLEGVGATKYPDTGEQAFLDADHSKLDAVEAAADVTDATNVNAAGATMNADTDVSGNGYVLDEDNMASDSATKLATQQSIKKYVDDNIGGGSVDTSGTPVDNDYAKFTDADTIEGRSYSEVKTDLSLNNVENTQHSTDAHTMTIDGRDVSADGSKLDGVEALADVTDASNVNAAGAVMNLAFDATSFLYATSENTPETKTPAEVIGILGAGSDWFIEHNFTDWGTIVSDGGAVTQEFRLCRCTTTTTANSWAQANAKVYNIGRSAAPKADLNLSKDHTVEFLMFMDADVASTWSWVMVTDPTRKEDPNDAGFGFRITNLDVYGLSHTGSALHSYSLSTTLTPLTPYRLRAEFIAGDKVYWYIDDVLKTSTDNIGSGVKEDCNGLVVASKNGSESAAQGITVMRIAYKRAY